MVEIMMEKQLPVVVAQVEKDTADNGVTGQGVEGSTYSPGGAESRWSSDKKKYSDSQSNVNIASSGSVNGVQNATTVL